MTLYVKAVGASITMVDVDDGVKFNVAPQAVQKLLGVDVKEGEVWEVSVRRREDLEKAFGRWQAIQQA